ncbi:MAG: DUF362 domain-containing protein [Clostridia bacterium]|nr:DUF362 domain-containing protein [Clostridia bacterium]
MAKLLCSAAGLADMVPAKDARIAIKPNLVVAGPAELGATTHPSVVAGLIEYLRENGFYNIVIMESAWYGEETENALVASGFDSLCREYDVPFIDIKKATSHKRDCGGMELDVTDAINDIDFFINVPVLKGHCQVRMTCAIKNLKGLIPDDEKRRFHALGINKPVGHLSTAIKQDFILVDDICGDLDFEEGGNPVVRNGMLAALDPVLVDAYACERLHLKLESVPYVGIAESLGIGSSDLESAEIINLRDIEEQEISKSSRVLDVAYAAEAVDACSACYGNLIPALIDLKEEGLLEKLDTKIAIGQGHNGKTGRLGIGQCTYGFDTCIMGCPPSREEIYDGLKKYIDEHC